MKKPEEIKKGLECRGDDGRKCGACSYRPDACFEHICEDALAYIQQLEAGIDHAEKVARECARSITENLDKLQSRLAQAERERDELLKERCSE